jgi:hypothetical protein
MKLRRSGSQRFRGWTNIFDRNDSKVEWNNSLDSVKLTVKSEYDLNSDSFYNYEIYLTLDDMQKIVAILADKGVGDSQDKIARTFSTQLDKLLKIMMCSVGIVGGSKKDDTKKS